MPYKGVDDDHANLLQFARRGAPPATGQTPGTVHALVPAAEAPTLRDEILGILRTLVADIEGGKVTPSHLIIGFGEKHENALSYVWECAGINLFETIGHLQVYAHRLAQGESE